MQILHFTSRFARSREILMALVDEVASFLKLASLTRVQLLCSSPIPPTSYSNFISLRLHKIF